MPEAVNQLPSDEQVTQALTSEPDVLAELTTEEQVIANKLILGAWGRKVLNEAEAKKAKELDTQLQNLIEENRKLMTAELDKIRKANEPLTPDELTKLVNQEYLEFNVNVASNGQPKTFVIKEMPVRSEKKLILAIRRELSGKVKEIASLDWSQTNTTLERIQKLVDMIPGAMETMAECTAICLDPYGEDSKINGDWVLDHLTTGKMLGILQLQMEANRWRDFFSLASRFIPSQTIM